MIKLAIFDIDDTLYSHKTETLPESASKTISLLREKGIKIAVASGREIKDDLMEKIINIVHPDYYVTANGQGLYDKSLKSIHSHHLDTESLDRLVEECKEKGNELLLKYESGIYMTSSVSKDLTRFQKGYPHVLADFTMDHYHQEECIGGSFLAKTSSAKLRPIAEMEKDYPNVNFIDIGNCYEMTTKGVNKMVTIKDLCKLLNITLDEVIAFGDSGNDVEVLKSVGLGIAMGNGQQVAKDAAAYITDSADEDGIYNACVHFNLF